MITEKVIKEIYKKFKKAPKNIDDLRIPYFVDLLKQHGLKFENGEVIVGALEEFNPFRRILARRLHGILEFDRHVAFIAPNHILFLGKNNDAVQVHMKPESNNHLLNRLFARG